MPRALAVLALLLALAGVVSACGGEGGGPDPDFGGGLGDEAGEDGGRLEDFAALSVATRNTTRLGGSSPVVDAAAAASAVFPATSTETRPSAVALVDRDDWQGAIAASVLAGRPLGAPVLLSDGDSVPDETDAALDRLRPRGADLARDAQVIRIGDRPPAPEGLRSSRVRGTDPYAVAAAVDRFWSAVRGRPSGDVVVASGEEAEFAMPAAAWAARSGDSVLFTRRNELPPPTARALRQHERPNIFVLGPESVISRQVERGLRRLGRVRRTGADGPAANAVEFARFRAGGFGWGIRVPGYNFTVASAARPADAGASAALATNGVFAPLLLTDAQGRLPTPTESYMLDVQPGFEEDPRTGVYNHIWILGDAAAVSANAQGRLDEITALIPVEINRP